MSIIASLQVSEQDSCNVLDFPLNRCITCLFGSNINRVLTFVKQVASKKGTCRIINVNSEKGVSLFVAFIFPLGLCSTLCSNTAVLKMSEILALQKSLAKFPLTSVGPILLLTLPCTGNPGCLRHSAASGKTTIQTAYWSKLN